MLGLVLTTLALAQDPVPPAPGPEGAIPAPEAAAPDAPALEVQRPQASEDEAPAPAEAASSEPAAHLEQRLPRHRNYRGLKKALLRYHGLRDKGGWAAVPGGPTLHPGDEGPRVTALRKRLAITGEYAGQGGLAVFANCDLTTLYVQPIQPVCDQHLPDSDIDSRCCQFENRIRALQFPIFELGAFKLELAHLAVAVNLDRPA